MTTAASSSSSSSFLDWHERFREKQIKMMTSEENDYKESCNRIGDDVENKKPSSNLNERSINLISKLNYNLHEDQPEHVDEMIKDRHCNKQNDNFSELRIRQERTTIPEKIMNVSNNSFFMHSVSIKSNFDDDHGLLLPCTFVEVGRSGNNSRGANEGAIIPSIRTLLASSPSVTTATAVMIKNAGGLNIEGDERLKK
jgi:hypothetical protein